MIELTIHKPLFKHSIASAFLLSIIGERNYEYSWIMNNFVNLRFSESLEYDDFYRDNMWYDCHFISESILTRELIDKYLDYRYCFSDFLEMALDSGHYIYCDLNRKYIKEYNKPDMNLNKNLVVFGYDETCFIMYDFLNGKLKRFRVDKSKINESYNNKEDKEYYSDYTKYRLIKKREDINYYEFNINSLVQKLNDYISSTNCYSRRTYIETTESEHIIGDIKELHEYKFGLDYYTVLKNLYLQNRAKTRMFQLLYIHKTLMEKRVEYLNKKGFYNIDKYEKLIILTKELKKESEILRNIYIKYKTTDKNKVIKKIDALKNKDYELTNLMLSSILI